MPTRHPVALALVAAVLALAGCGGDAGAGIDGGDGSDGETSAPAATTSDAATADTTVDATTSAPDDEGTQRFPDVVEAEVTPSGAGWVVAATISSPYDSPERYADAFRVLAPDGTELGVRELLHDHAGEQPFTRSTGAITIPDDVTEVIVEGRDQDNGWGGATVTVPVPR
jgi:hypothetical protein